MSRSADIELEWGDGRYNFRLDIAHVEKLEEELKVGSIVVLNRLLTFSCFIPDIRETIRLGLIGGGMDPIKARKFVDEHFVAGKILEHVGVASIVLGTAINGASDEPVGNAVAAEEAETTVSQTAGSPSPPSTEPAQ